ncbi:MAG: hypothetical protein S0880_33950 [Actinomycetota bacterium]|nr:hypothetical protein [Actinomycetota bacterium]
MTEPERPSGPVVVVADATEAPARVLERLRLPPLRRTVVVNGGTREGTERDTRLDTMFGHLLTVLPSDSLLLTGGTEAGVFVNVGRAAGTVGFGGPVVGVAPAGRVAHGPIGDDRTGATGGRLHDVEEHHTHVVAVRGEEFGEETPMMVALTAALATRMPLVVVLVGGGDISRREIEPALAAGRHVVALHGTGRLADELAARTPQPSGLHLADIGAPDTAAAMIAGLVGVPTSGGARSRPS